MYQPLFPNSVCSDNLSKAAVVVLTCPTNIWSPRHSCTMDVAGARPHPHLSIYFSIMAVALPYCLLGTRDLPLLPQNYVCKPYPKEKSREDCSQEQPCGFCHCSCSRGNNRSSSCAAAGFQVKVFRSSGCLCYRGRVGRCQPAC